MFNIGWAELFVISVLILIVFGPKDLPRLLYEGAKWIRAIRSYAREFHTHVDRIVRDVEFQEIKKEVDKIKNAPLDLEQTIDPNQSIKKTFSSITTPPPSPPSSTPSSLEPSLKPAPPPPSSTPSSPEPPLKSVDAPAPEHTLK